MHNGCATSFLLYFEFSRRQLEDVFNNSASGRMGDFSLYIYSKERGDRKERDGNPVDRRGEMVG